MPFVFHVPANMDLIKHNDYGQLPYLKYGIYRTLENILYHTQADYYKIELLAVSMAVPQSFRGK